MNRIGYLFEAIKSYDNALSINDTDAEVKWNKANCNLLLGDYKNGWDNFDLDFINLIGFQGTLILKSFVVDLK